VLNQVLIHEFPPAHNQAEVDAEIGERVIADKRLALGKAALNGLHHLAGGLHGDALDMLQVAVLADANLHQDRLFFVRPVKVRSRDDARCALGMMYSEAGGWSYYARSH
jgi:hypothetical protein